VASFAKAVTSICFTIDFEYVSKNPFKPDCGLCKGMMAFTTKKTPTTQTRRLISVALSLICGIFIAGRLHFKHWAHELARYQTVRDNDALVSIVFDTLYLLLRIFVGGYGSYAVFRDLIGPMFGQRTGKQKTV
jgi:hypothetical protein